MRDILLTLILIGFVFAALGRPWVGVMLWVWVSIMNPHRLTFGFAYSLPVAMIAAAVVLVSLPFAKNQPIRMPLGPPVVMLFLFVLWINIAAPFAIYPELNWDMYSKVMKIMFMTFVALAVLHTTQHVKALVLTLVVSLAFFGVKGGIFTILNGGQYMVRGPNESFIGPNNELALALVMTIPLIRFVQLQATHRWQRLGLLGVMLLTAFAALGSQSRGALLALGAMAAWLWLRSRQKLPVLAALVVAAPLMLTFMPDSWWNRMGTIDNYEEDASAQGRINSWWMAWNLARDRFFGGGFDIYYPAVFEQYAPVPDDVHAAHSIYFQVLGEHGFGALFLFLAIWLTTWFCLRAVRKQASRLGEQWAVDLANMCEVSLIGYAVGGAFLSLSYFDLPYYILVAIVVTRYKILEPMVTGRAAAPTPPPARRAAAVQDA